MLQASTEEDYVEASRLKNERNEAKKSAIKALSEAEQSMYMDEKSNLNELSLSSISGVNPSFQISPSEKSYHEVQSESKDKEHGKLKKSLVIETGIEEEEEELEQFEYDNHGVTHSKQDESSVDDSSIEDEANALEGVENYTELPIPEKINMNECDMTPDQIGKIEKVIGDYRTRCFLSKNWILREAALVKICMILRELGKDMKNNNNNNDSFGQNETYKVFCTIIERAVSDRIVQVYISSLLLLDENIAIIEKDSNMNKKNVVTLISTTTSILVTKLGDSKQKVVDGAETALMSLALSPCVGPCYVCNCILKIKSERNAKVGKSLCTRLNFLQKIVMEFWEEVGNFEKIMDFIKGTRKSKILPLSCFYQIFLLQL